MRVQIAGLKNLGDTLKAVNAGADAIGLVVGVTHTSGDEVDIETAKNIFLSMPPLVCKTLITHLTDEKDLTDLIDYIRPTAVQLHSIDISFITIARLKANYPYVKFFGVVHANMPKALEKAIDLSKITDAIFTDTKTANRLGGTGVTHDWSVSAKIALLIQKPLILAGGLSPENVLQAVNMVKPYGVDVNSGVKANGMFDSKKMQSFITEAKNWRI